MLERELALYRWYLAHGRRVVLVTYGNGEDIRLGAKAIPGAQVCCNEYNMDLDTYAKAIPRLHGAVLRDLDVFKTNQVPGAGEALAASRVLGKPLLVRCGYLPSYIMGRRHGQASKEKREALSLETEVFRQAEHVVVTTREMAVDVLRRVPHVRVTVVPNYVAPEFFPPRETMFEFDCCFVGRLHPEKNVLALLDAVRETPWRVLVVGDGELRDEVASRVDAMGERIRWELRVCHSQLPARMNQARLFILPSLYEGHPKTLMEAMFLGMPVVGADSPGIEPLVRDSGGGWLCGHDARAIHNVLHCALSSPDELRRRGISGQCFARRHFDLESVAALEERVLRDTVNTSHAPVRNKEGYTYG
ncbi:glycosyltransferase family 4 protein [Desulfosarcina ovata]|nr:glycosyltransferase family 4 protein [Desulfosarcina ovata]